MTRWQSTTPTESGFRKAVIELAEAHDWYVVPMPDGEHMRRIPKSMVGWPDLYMVRFIAEPDSNGDYVLRMTELYRELKVGRNTLSIEQESWGRRLILADKDYAVWRDTTPWSQIEEDLR